MSAFSTAMFYDAMESLQKKHHAMMRERGFWDGDNDNLPTKLMLLVSETAEWLELYRSGTLDEPCEKRVPKHGTDGVSDNDSQRVGIIDGKAPEGHRPITRQEEEAADIFLRLLDMCERWGIDLARVTLAKMQYNETREHRHGGKKC